MADQELIDITEDTSPAASDFVYKVNAAGDTDGRVSLTNLLKGMLGIRSEPPSGGYQITNLYMNASHEMVIEYKGTAEP